MTGTVFESVPRHGFLRSPAHGASALGQDKFCFLDEVLLSRCFSLSREVCTRLLELGIGSLANFPGGIKSEQFHECCCHLMRPMAQEREEWVRKEEEEEPRTQK